MNKQDMAQAAKALLVFAVLCFVTALGFNITTGSLISELLPPAGGVVGPIRVEKDRSVYHINVAQNVGRDGVWNQVTGEVLDENKNPLFSFGEEFWKESGYDDGGRWSEQKTDYDIKITLQKGSYFLGLNSENQHASLSQVRVTVKKKGGSAVPFFTAGVIALIIGVIVNEMAKGSIGRGLKGMDSEFRRWE
ncbi:MAG: hypothetical protein ACE5F7_06485 [Nitrospiria bacterium]